MRIALIQYNGKKKTLQVHAKTDYRSLTKHPHCKFFVKFTEECLFNLLYFDISWARTAWFRGAGLHW